MPSDISSPKPVDSGSTNSNAVDSDAVESPLLPQENDGELSSKSPVSSDQDGTVGVPRTQVDWYRSTPWWRLISQSVHISWRSSHLFLCGVAIFLTWLSWQACMLCFAPDFAVAIPVDLATISLADTDATELAALAASNAQRFQSQVAIDRLTSGGILSFLPDMRSFFESILIIAPWTLRNVAFGVTYALAVIGIWGFFGGIIARRSVIELGVRTSIGWVPSLKLVASRWRSIVWSILMPLASIAMLALIPLTLGALCRLGSIGQAIALIGAFPGLLVMLGVGWITAIAGLGFPLSVCAIVSEKGADAFDGLSRSAAYLFQRPMSVLCILIVALGVGSLGYWVLDLVLDCGELFFLAAMSLGYGGDLIQVVSRDSSTFPGLLFIGLQSVLGGLRMAYLLSFFWTASAAAYLTLRWEIDHTDFDDLDLQELGEPVAIPKITEEP